MKRSRPVYVLLVLLALLIAACSSSNNKKTTSTTGGNAKAASSGTPGKGAAAPVGGSDTKPLVIARDMDVNSLDPHLAYCDTCQIYLTATYETVIGLDTKDNQTFLPRLAKKWSVSADLKQFTFELDPRATFSDGSPVEAKDVKWSWERLENLKGSGSYFMDDIASIDTPDPHTVVVHKAAADSAFLAKVNASYAGVVNSKVATDQGAISAVGADKSDKAEPWFLKHSAGSGPYILVNYQEGSELRLTLNDKYWGTKPPIKDVIIKQVKDAVAQRQLLESGEADIAMQIDPDLASKMKSGGDVTIQLVPSYNFIDLTINPASQTLNFDLNDKLRQAIRYAIDYDGLIKVALGGAGLKQAAPIPNGFLGTKDLPLPVHDVAKAKQLLAEGGQPNGFELTSTFSTLNVYGVDFVTAMQKVQTDLGEVGIKVKLEPSEVSVVRDKAKGPGIALGMSYFAPDHTDTSQYPQFFGMVPGGLYQGRVSKGRATPIINQAEVDLLAKALATVDLTERGKIYGQFGLEMIKDGYIIALVNPKLVLAYRSNLQGMHYSTCCNLDLGVLSRK